MNDEREIDNNDGGFLVPESIRKGLLDSIRSGDPIRGEEFPIFEITRASEKLKVITDRILQIMRLVKSMEDNNAACWSMVTHVIFEDYNLGVYRCEKALEDHEGWAQYIKDMSDISAPNTMGFAFSGWLKEVIDVHDVLYKLCTFTEAEHEVAEEFIDDLGIGWSV